MTWTSRYPTVFTRSSDRRHIPFMGVPELHFSQGWDLAWTPLQLHLRSQLFLDQLGPQPNTLTMASVVQSLLDAAAWRIKAHVGVALGRTVLNSATDAQRLYVGTSFTKASNPFRPGTAMFDLAEARRRAATLPTPTPASVFAPYVRYLNAAQQLTLNLIQDLTEAQKAQALAIIVQGFKDNKPPRQIANELADAIGLNARWLAAVENFRDALASTAISPSVLDRRVTAYANKLRKKRGEMVARTEMMRAMNAGRYEFWQDRAGSGELASDSVVKMWITAPGACPDCLDVADMNAAGVPDMVEGLDTPFNTPFGKVLYPPLHPHCRCTINYVVRRGGGEVSTGAVAGLDDVDELTDVEIARLMNNSAPS